MKQSIKNQKIIPNQISQYNQMDNRYQNHQTPSKPQQFNIENKEILFETNNEMMIEKISTLNFQIAEESPHKQNDNKQILKQFFLRVKNQIQKVLNDEQISVQIFEIIPAELQSEFEQLINYIKIKINQKYSPLSFILPYQEQFLGQSLFSDYPDIIAQQLELKKMIELINEKERVIIDLTTEKQIHEKTIVQLAQEKQQIQEENQNKFINQMALLKKQLKEAKQKIDSLQLTLSTTKRSLFKILDVILSDQKDLEEDLEQAFSHYSSLCKLNQRENQLLSIYLNKYSLRNKAKRSFWFK